MKELKHSYKLSIIKKTGVQTLISLIKIIIVGAIIQALSLPAVLIFAYGVFAFITGFSRGYKNALTEVVEEYVKDDREKFLMSNEVLKFYFKETRKTGAMVLIGFALLFLIPVVAASLIIKIPLIIIGGIFLFGAVLMITKMPDELSIQGGKQMMKFEIKNAKIEGGFFEKRTKRMLNTNVELDKTIDMLNNVSSLNDLKDIANDDEEDDDDKPSTNPTIISKKFEENSVRQNNKIVKQEYTWIIEDTNSITTKQLIINDEFNYDSFNAYINKNVTSKADAFDDYCKWFNLHKIKYEIKTDIKPKN